MRLCDRKTKRTVVGVAIVMAGLSLPACASFRAERHGKELGEALCDLKGADTAEEASEATADALRELEDAIRIVGRPVSEDVDDVQENLDDLTEHVGQPALIEQDLANIRRNVAAATQVADESSKRFYQGVGQGLAECTP